MGDVDLAVAIALTQAALGIMGIYVALKPQQQYHGRWIAMFVVTALAGVGFTGWLTEHSAHAQEKSLKDIQNVQIAATNANIAATNANNAASGAQQETTAARAEARKATVALGELINQRAKAAEEAQQKQIKRSARPLDELIVSLHLETNDKLKTSVNYPTQLRTFLVDALRHHRTNNDVVLEVSGNPAISMLAYELPERFKGKNSPLVYAGLYSISFFRRGVCSKAIYERQPDLVFDPEADVTKVLVGTGAAIDDRLVMWTYIEGDEGLRVEIDLRYDITMNAGSITSIEDIPGSTMLFEAHDPDTVYTPTHIKLIVPGRASFDVVAENMTALQRPEGGLQDYCYRFPARP